MYDDASYFVLYTRAPRMDAAEEMEASANIRNASVVLNFQLLYLYINISYCFFAVIFRRSNNKKILEKITNTTHTHAHADTERAGST